MELKISPDDVYEPSPDIVAREIDGEILIIPLVSGIGDIEDELYSLNETGKAIWRLLDGENTIMRIVDQLARDYAGDKAEIKKDVFGLLHEFKKRKFLVKKAS